MLVLARASALLLFAAASTLTCAAANSAIPSESQITISGTGIPGETFSLPRAYGDWFLSAADGHASLTLLTAVNAVHQVKLSLEWNGAGLTETINAVNNNAGAHNRFSFYVTLSGGGAYNQTAWPRGADAMTITVTKMDDKVLEATISGSVTGNGQLKIFGFLKLHRLAGPGLVTGSLGDCDAKIYDKLAGAEWRSPSACEVKFDARVRQGLVPVVAPVVARLAQTGWVEIKKPKLDPLDAIARHSEKEPYKLESSHDGAFLFSLTLQADAPIYQRFSKTSNDAMQKAAEQMKAGGAVTAMGAAEDAARAMQENTTIVIGILINEASTGIYNFKGGHTVTPLASGGYAIEVPHAQAATGGGEDASQRATYVFFGAWAPPGRSSSATGPENIQVKGTLNPGNLMAVQNVRIRIEADTALAQQVIKLIDWNALQTLMAESQRN
jgi:hypothetical protein